MRKTLLAAAAMMLIPLGGCATASNNMAQDNGAETIEASANAYQRLADQAANAAVANQTIAADAADANAAGATDNMQ